MLKSLPIGLVLAAGLLVAPAVSQEGVSQDATRPDASAPAASSDAAGSEAVPVSAIQAMLKELGYAAGPTDGLLGPQTRAAIRAFQRANDRPVTGQPGAALQAALRTRTNAADTTTADDAATDAQAADGASDRAAGDAGAGVGDTSEQPDGGSQAADTGSTPPASGTAPGADDSVGAADPSVSAPGRAAAKGESTASVTDRPARIAIAGTRWRITDSTGARFTLHFEPDGRLDGPTAAGTWRWERVRGSLVITYDAGGNLRTRRVAPWPRENAMRGAAASADGRSWTWQANRLDGHDD